MGHQKIRLAVLVSHPIQYYVPLYRRLAARGDLEVKVFFTWHAGTKAQHDPGFGRPVAWDIPLTDGYEYELIENVARKPGSRHFWGIRTPQLVERVMTWGPDAVQITGYAYASHLQAMRALHRKGIPVLFRGDSHLLDQKTGWRWLLKRAVLKCVYGWTSACLYVGKNNYDYYRRIGVSKHKLHYCPHCIEVQRFAEPNEELEARAKAWRRDLEIGETTSVILYAGKFEQCKRSVEFLRAMLGLTDRDIVTVMVGSGPLENEVHDLARAHQKQVRVIPFQNQALMPVVYRLGDILVLPSTSETWGLALNEAIACGRRVIASDRVGGAIDIITSTEIGAIFRGGDWSDFRENVLRLLATPHSISGLKQAARRFDISATEHALLDVLRSISPKLANPVQI